MRFTEIGQQLRAYRLESGLRAEEIAARLGISRAALYRYEKGDVIKLDTVNRLAELLKISPLSLLGIGSEYYYRPIGYFERIRQIEETADQVLLIAGTLPYLITSEDMDGALSDIFAEQADQPGADRAGLRTLAEQVLGLLSDRKKMYRNRRPNIIALLPATAAIRLLEQGIGQGTAMSARLQMRARAVARAELENMANIMESEPMGLQLGLITAGEPNGQFKILRARDRAMLAVNPFRVDGLPQAQTGVAMITGADEAISAHQRVAETMWREAIKGREAASRLRAIIAAHPTNQ